MQSGCILDFHSAAGMSRIRVCCVDTNNPLANAFASDAKALASLPRYPYQACDTQATRVNSLLMVCYRTVRAYNQICQLLKSTGDKKCLHFPM